MSNSSASAWQLMGESHTTRSNNKSTMSTTAMPVSLNNTLQTEHLDIPEEDNSFLANLTRKVSKIVGAMFSPRQVLGLLRVLKAITLSFLVLTILSDLMYIIFVELFSSSEVHTMAGGNRDVIIRIYGIVLALIGLAIELDYSKIVKKFAGLKGFIPRSVMYFLIVQITGSHPILIDYRHGINADHDDVVDDDNVYSDVQAAIPSSAVGFQRVTSFVLGLCSLGYLVCGILCFDRFTARAFLCNKDPRITTAIPPANTSKSDVLNTSNSTTHTSHLHHTNNTSNGKSYSVSTGHAEDMSSGNGESMPHQTIEPPGW